MIRSLFAIVALRAVVGEGNIQRCSVGNNPGKVVSVSDGTNERCVAVIASQSANLSATADAGMPLLFWFHGSGGSAAHCNGELATLAQNNGFALVCAEALQFDATNNGQSGLWRIPEIITDTTGTPCEDSDSVEIPYIKNVISTLGSGVSGLPKFDTTRVFTSGCSMGSAFSEYTAMCLKDRSPSVLSAFATHSTGLKVKGDGNRMPRDEYDSQYEWGECPKCQYFPMKPKVFSDPLGLKACIFDNTGDGDFYKTSEAMEKQWKSLGMKTESHYASGGHCQIQSYPDIVNCLDDGTHRLLQNGPSPSPPPAPPSPPSPPSPGPSPETPPAKCQQCFVNGCRGVEHKDNDACRTCVQKSQQTCASSCVPYPFGKAQSWFCSPLATVVV